MAAVAALADAIQHPKTGNGQIKWKLLYFPAFVARTYPASLIRSTIGVGNSPRGISSPDLRLLEEIRHHYVVKFNSWANRAGLASLPITFTWKL